MSVCIFRWQTILTRVSPPSQKTIYNFNLVVGNTTKHMKHGRSCDIIQMMHGEWTLKYDESEVENVAGGRSPSATFSTEGHRISMSHERLCLTCFVAPPGAQASQCKIASTKIFPANQCSCLFIAR